MMALAYGSEDSSRLDRNNLSLCIYYCYYLSSRDLNHKRQTPLYIFQRALKTLEEQDIYCCLISIANGDTNGN